MKAACTLIWSNSHTQGYESLSKPFRKRYSGQLTPETSYLKATLVTERVCLPVRTCAKPRHPVAQAPTWKQRGLYFLVAHMQSPPLPSLSRAPNSCMHCRFKSIKHQRKWTNSSARLGSVDIPYLNAYCELFHSQVSYRLQWCHTFQCYHFFYILWNIYK